MSGPDFIISGTDTGVGKTIFAAGLAAALGAAFWKPVQAGLKGETDSETVARLTTGSGVTIYPEAYRLTTPCSPHAAALADGCTIELSRLTLPSTSGRLLVEGAGGVLVPYRNDLLAADIFAFWSLPVILVARTSLGTINHSLLSIEALRARNVPIAGRRARKHSPSWVHAAIWVACRICMISMPTRFHRRSPQTSGSACSHDPPRAGLASVHAARVG